MKESGIYQIQSKINPKRIYIGSAVNLKNRESVHFHLLKKDKHHSNKLQNHYNKYGESDLVFSVLMCCDKADLVKHEQFFIDSFHSYFNICPNAGNTLGRKLSDETKDKIRKTRIGKLLTEEHKLKIGKASTGRKHSEESKMKNRIASMGIRIVLVVFGLKNQK